MITIGRRPGPQQSFCVVREPVDKLLSEFNFRTNEKACTNSFLQSWVKQKLQSTAKSKRYIDDCHLVPSEDYYHSCDFPIPYDKHHEGVGMLLRVRFNITLNFKVVHPMWAKRCFMKVENLTSESLEIIQDFYKEDIRLFRKARVQYGVLIKQGMVSPQIPDLCPKNKQCGRNDKNCPFDGCKVAMLWV